MFTCSSSSGGHSRCRGGTDAAYLTGSPALLEWQSMAWEADMEMLRQLLVSGRAGVAMSAGAA